MSLASKKHNTKFWRLEMDKKRMKTGQKLLDSALEFWKACQQEGQHGAVQWLEGSNGELLIFTRAEYRAQLMANIERLSRQAEIHVFRESLADFGGEK
jgi:hypothetical protein